MKKLGKNATAKRSLLKFLIIIRTGIISTVFGGKSVTHTEKYIEMAARLDARKKDFKENLVKIMVEYIKYLESKTTIPQNGNEKIIVNKKIIPTHRNQCK